MEDKRLTIWGMREILVRISFTYLFTRNQHTITRKTKRWSINSSPTMIHHSPTFPNAIPDCSLTKHSLKRNFSIQVKTNSQTSQKWWYFLSTANIYGDNFTRLNLQNAKTTQVITKVSQPYKHQMIFTSCSKQLFLSRYVHSIRHLSLYRTMDFWTLMKIIGIKLLKIWP